ncbi:MAG: YifB family Mg chelatase-like AAA ATPase [Lachnospiraceae bacterium]|nr:YifB family Mg chelatase-like AAA ATPase [Lachnospiraceae bacterium]
MYSSVLSAAVYGIEAQIINCEADVSDGLPLFNMVGFLASEVKEARDRVRTALKNSGFAMRPKHITINLSPADMRKSGTGFDLPITLAVMAASGLIPGEQLEGVLVVGELGLDGEIKGIPGILPIVLAARENGIKKVIVPKENVMEAGVVQGVDCYGSESLAQLVEFLYGAEDGLGPVRVDTDSIFVRQESEAVPDFSEVAGQAAARRAAEIAAAGQHNLLMSGPPGAGKTMIARRMPGIMPKLSFDESMELTRIYSVAGKLGSGMSMVTRRPFRSPHHTATVNSVIGGGQYPRPGEVSLAVNGILYLDELPEFSREVIEALRQPLEDKEVHISRLSASYTYPAGFMLVASMNPCPCGFYPDRNRCTCSPSMINRYRRKISRPILDRIDLCVNVEEIEYKALSSIGRNESSEAIRQRVESARSVQEKRYRGLDINFNSQLTGSEIMRFCELGKEERKMMENAFEAMNLSARGYHRILRVARTIADMDGSERIRSAHLAEALGYRMGIAGMDEMMK